MFYTKRKNLQWNQAPTGLGTADLGSKWAALAAVSDTGVVNASLCLDVYMPSFRPGAWLVGTLGTINMKGTSCVRKNSEVLNIAFRQITIRLRAQLWRCGENNWTSVETAQKLDITTKPVQMKRTMWGFLKFSCNIVSHLLNQNIGFQACDRISYYIYLQWLQPICNMILPY